MTHLATPLLAVNVWPLVQGLVMTLFVLCCLLMLLVILIQEGKGGGVAGAFGGAAAESFGVKAGTVNRFTAILATIFMGLALLHAGIASATGGSVIPREAPVPASGNILPGTGAPPMPPEPPGTPDGEEPPTTPPGMTETPPGMTETPPGMTDDAAMGDAAMGTEAPPTPPPAPPAPSMGG